MRGFKSVPGGSRSALLGLALLLAASAAGVVQAQYGEANATMPGLYSGDARLFVVTNGDELVVLDLPSGRQSVRLQLPLPSTLLRVSLDRRYFLAFRSRTYGPEFMTVVRTGVVRNTSDSAEVEQPYASPFSVPAGPAKLLGLPCVVRTLDIGDSIVPSHDNYLMRLNNMYMMSEEKKGALLMFPPSALEPKAAWQPTELLLEQPDHYAVMGWNATHIYIGYIELGLVKLINLTGQVLETHNCTGVHGEAHWESPRGAKVGAFGCEDGIRIVYGNGSTTFIPSETRVASFIQGSGSSIFGVGRDLASLYRVDLSAARPAITKISSGGERRGHVLFPGSSYFAQIHTSGNLTVHDGATGAVVAHTWALPSVDINAVPSLAVYKNRYVYLTAPQWGQVRVVDVTLPAASGGAVAQGSARVVEQLPVGGRPLRLLLVD